MAVFDNTQWLLSHIQNSYATSDDSSLSEVLLQGNWPVEKLVDFPFLYPDDSITTGEPFEDYTPHSPDLHADQSYVGHRFRSDTEHRLNEIRKEKNMEAKITRLTWHPTTTQLSESEAEAMFGARPVPSLPLKSQLSLLAQLVEQDDVPVNPYLEYARWDASTDVNVATKRLSVFVYTNVKVAPSYPVRVVVSASARVLDVIGLTCFLYTRDKGAPPLTLPAHAYSLHIADEDGTVDWVFTALPHSNGFDKFGFRVLAVAPTPPKPTDGNAGCLFHQRPITVTVHISGGVFSLIECESPDVTLKEVLNRTVNKRREMARIVEAGVQYHLERADDEPGRTLDLDRSLADVQSVEFYAVRDNSKRTPSAASGTAEDGTLPLLSFPVTWTKKWAKFDATIDVSLGGVYLSVTGGGSGGLLRPPHPVSYPSNKIVCCNLKSSHSVSGTSGKKTLAGLTPNKDKITAESGKAGKKSGGGISAVAGLTEGTKSDKEKDKGDINTNAGTVSSSSSSSNKNRCEVVLTCQGEQRFKDYMLECEESVGQELVEAIRKVKTEDQDAKKKKARDGEEDGNKPRRRYSLPGLKRRSFRPPAPN